MTTVFRYQADKLPVAIILGLTAVDFAVFFLVNNIWFLFTYFLLMVIPKGSICAWNHHHQHTKTFHQTPLNRVLELIYALHTGVTTNLWLLHHVLGHHHHYLDQTLDESRWMRRDGSKMGALEYTLIVAGTAYYRGYLVGKRYPKHYYTHLIYTLITLSVVGALTWYKPLASLLLFILPMVISLLITAWTTYEHHTGLDTKDHFEASYNQLNRVFNLVTGNLGYHTAHHSKQGLHWSELPKLHETIKDNIPEQLYKGSLWDLTENIPIPGFISRLFSMNR